jgi:hypothetical protein
VSVFVSVFVETDGALDTVPTVSTSRMRRSLVQACWPVRKHVQSRSED